MEELEAGLDDEDDVLASCWIEARQEYISRIYWGGLERAVQYISVHLVPDGVDTWHLLESTLPPSFPAPV